MKDSVEERKLYMALELSRGKWRLAFGDGAKSRQVTVEAGDMEGLVQQIGKAKERFRLAAEAAVASCYEVGRDGFWLHRYLASLGIDNRVVDSSSIEVNRRARRAKTDGLDAGKLLGLLVRYHGGETKVWSVVRVPSEGEEDGRRLHRELERLKKERLAHSARLKSLLALHGIAPQRVGGRDWAERVEAFKQWNGRALPGELRAELVREQVRALEAEQRRRLSDERDDPLIKQMVQLMQLKAVGQTGAWLLVMEFYGWRRFRNRRQVGALAGMTGTPYSSGDQERDQGISKAGNRRIRALIVEMAWMWLRYQGGSELARWFNRRFAHGGKRLRRIGIVALGRRLLVELWRYLQTGALPEGAQLKAV